MAGAGSKIRAWLGVLATAAAITWLVVHYDIAAAVRAIRGAQMGTLALLAPVLLAMYLLRALRWQILIAQSCPVRFGAVFRSLMIGNLVNNVVPAKAGELVRAHVLGREQSVSRSVVFGTVVAERVGDVAVLVCLLALVAVSYELPAWVQAGAWSAAVLAAIGLLLMSRGPSVLIWTKALLGPRLMANSLARAAEGMLGRIAEGAGNALRLRAVAAFTVISIVIWALEIAIALIAARAFGLPLGVSEAILLILMLAIGTLVPAAIANIGPYEFFGLSVLKAIGVGGDAALAFILTLHASSVLAVVVLAAASILLVRKHGRAEDPVRETS
jgi:uncharacterized protein (TIRG00374 family)